MAIRTTGQGCRPSGLLSCAIACRMARATWTARCGNCSRVCGRPKSAVSGEGACWTRRPPNPWTFAAMACSQHLARVQGSAYRKLTSMASGHVRSITSTATGFCSQASPLPPSPWRAVATPLPVWWEKAAIAGNPEAAAPMVASATEEDSRKRGGSTAWAPAHAPARTAVRSVVPGRQYPRCAPARGGDRGSPPPGDDRGPGGSAHPSHICLNPSVWRR
jgi:hypothetical protein